MLTYFPTKPTHFPAIVAGIVWEDWHEKNKQEQKGAVCREPGQGASGGAGISGMEAQQEQVQLQRHLRALRHARRASGQKNTLDTGKAQEFILLQSQGKYPEIRGRIHVAV